MSAKEMSASGVKLKEVVFFEGEDDEIRVVLRRFNSEDRRKLTGSSDAKILSACVVECNYAGGFDKFIEDFGMAESTLMSELLDFSGFSPKVRAFVPT